MTDFADFNAISVGDECHIERTITEDDIRRFVQLTGDNNPLHVDPAFAAQTPFKDIVVHGMLGASFISALIGTRLPGPGALWLSQELEFLMPVRLGDVLVVSSSVTAKHDRDRLLDLQTLITNQHGQTVLRGHGRVKVLVVADPPKRQVEGDQGSRVALVTGGSGGIGEAICRRLAREGYRVAVHYSSGKSRADRVVDAIRSADGTASAIEADLSTAVGAARLAEKTINLFGDVGVLVNNASPEINPKGFLDTRWTDMQEHLDVQLQSSFMLAQHCIPGMVSSGKGRIVHITSQVVRGDPAAKWTAYSVAKAALGALSRQLAVELGPSGITVNCVAPGMTETTLIGSISEKQQLIVGRQTPLRRLAHPEDIAAAVAFLVSDDARFVTGHTINVNGGMEMS